MDIIFIPWIAYVTIIYSWVKNNVRLVIKQQAGYRSVHKLVLIWCDYPHFVCKSKYRHICCSLIVFKLLIRHCVYGKGYKSLAKHTVVKPLQVFLWYKYFLTCIAYIWYQYMFENEFHCAFIIVTQGTVYSSYSI